jgi:hypothetical protein
MIWVNMDWIDPAQDRNHGMDLVNTAMSLQDP